MEIYPARELPIENVNSQMILDRMTNPNKQIMSFKEILEFVNKNKPEVLMTLGAGDIDTIVPKIKIILS
jgi:UDP-N-acetylmuramate--alanine ligase